MSYDSNPDDLSPLHGEDGERPRKSQRARGSFVRFFSFLMTLAFVAVLAFAGIVLYGKTQFEARGPLQEDTTFVVPDGASFQSIIPALEEQGIIPQQTRPSIFGMGVRAAGKLSDLKAGEFPITAGMSMKQVMLQLTEGRPVTKSITFPEGWTSWRIMERIAADERLTGPVPDIPPEGSLLPNTYDLTRGATKASIIERMQQAQRQAVAEIWENRAEGLPLESPQDLVTLASIVEKETGVGSERAHVASVFINRLRKNMRLDTDPTVIYGIWGGEGKPADYGGIRQSDLNRITPYNTRKIKGLPPTPIANPGLEAMRAVARPLETDDLYFVADGTGGHVFAKTLKEHNANVREWRKIEADRKRARENGDDQ